MSKNFEEDYREYIEKIKPDLWNKIAEQLPEREQIREDAHAAMEPSVEHQQKIISFSKKKKMTTLAGVAAACLCAAILIPVYVNNREEMQKNSLANAYDSHHELLISESAVDMDKLLDNKANSIDVIKTDALIQEVSDEYVTMCVLSSDNEIITMNSEITVAVDSSLSLTEGSSYHCELIRDKKGNFVLKSAEIIK